MRMLKPGGALLLTVPANPWMWTAHDAVHHHHRRYRKREIAALARLTGFRTQLLSPFNTFLFPPIAAVRAAGKITGKEESDDRLPPPALNRALTSLSQTLGRAPTVAELATELDIEPDEVEQGLTAGNSYRTTPLDTASRRQSSSSVHVISPNSTSSRTT